MSIGRTFSKLTPRMAHSCTPQQDESLCGALSQLPESASDVHGAENLFRPLLENPLGPLGEVLEDRRTVAGQTAPLDQQPLHAGQVLNIGAGLGNMTPLLRSWATMFMAWNASGVTGYSFRKRMGSPEGVSGR